MYVFILFCFTNFLHNCHQVAALSGDARRALDICRRATELAELETEKAKKVGLVGMKHVDAALQEMFSSPKIVAIRSVNHVGFT